MIPTPGLLQPPTSEPMSESSVSILLCTYQGERYLREQLDSFEAQTHAVWRLWASDDGSTDGTRDLLEARKQVWPMGKLTLIEGPARGFTANFLSLAVRAEIRADAYAFSDQDDIWEPQKLARALDWLDAIPEGVPALYCSRTQYVNATGAPIGLSPCFMRRPPSFQNALVQNIGGGNTMVFNEAARALLQEAGPDVAVEFHDRWVYLLVSGSGGHVHYDPWPSLRYRQHGANLIGMNSSCMARLNRIRMLFGGHFRASNEAHVAALAAMAHRLTPAHRTTLEAFAKGRLMSLFPRLRYLWASGVHRQTLPGNLALGVAAILGRV